MGNVIPKCTCICSKKDEELIESVNMKPCPTEKTINNSNKAEYFMNSKKFHPVENQNENNKNLVKLQACIRGCLYRKKFPKIKIKLFDQMMKKLESYQVRFQSPNQVIGEALRGKFNSEGWKRFYPNESSNGMFKYDPTVSGKVFHTYLLIYNDISFYTGQVNLKNQRCGYGILTDNVGAKYEGTWVNNKLTGWCRMIDIDGNLYEGYFICNLLNGKGEKITQNGVHYVGDFRNNLKHGKGREETDEIIYEGDFKNDKKEGLGKLTYKGVKDSYEGEFSDNAITGSGIYRWANGDIFEGTFQNGKMHGRGIYKWADGGVYEGQYVDNLKEGQGVLQWKKGRIYKGAFSKGHPHGNGIMLIDNIKHQVEFHEGKIIRADILIPNNEMKLKESIRENLISLNGTSCNSDLKKSSSKGYL